VWLAPVQAVVLPITDRQLDYGREVEKRLSDAGVRVQLDDRKEKVNLKIRDAQMQKVPYMLVLGDREEQNRTVSVRNRKHGDQGVKPLDEFLGTIQDLIERRTPVE
jgi:threonyl-tRNA synthetase